MSNPLISIISVHYNGTGITEEFIKSILQISYSPVEIFIVDNGSQIEPVEPLIEKYPEIKFIVSDENLGFAGGNNLAIQQAAGEYLFFVNNDTEVPVNFMEPLVEHFETHPKTGMASPLIKYFNTNIIQYAGNEKISLLTGRSKRLGIKEEDKGQYNFNFPTEMIHGAALLVRRQVIEDIGLMPEVFFLYYEEIDWCTQAQNKGYQTWVIGKSTVYHKESMSVGKNSPFKLYYMTRNRILYLRRNTNGVRRISWISFFLLITIPKNTLLFLIKREFQSLKSFYRGVLWHLSH